MGWPGQAHGCPVRHLQVWSRFDSAKASHGAGPRAGLERRMPEGTESLFLGGFGTQAALWCDLRWAFQSASRVTNPHCVGRDNPSCEGSKHESFRQPAGRTLSPRRCCNDSVPFVSSVQGPLAGWLRVFFHPSRSPHRPVCNKRTGQPWVRPSHDGEGYASRSLRHCSDSGCPSSIARRSRSAWVWV